MKRWIRIALEREIVVTGIWVSLVVGTILIIINYGDMMVENSLHTGHYLKMGLTYLVPYCVSTYSAVKTELRLIEDGSDGGGTLR